MSQLCAMKCIILIGNANNRYSRLILICIHSLVFIGLVFICFGQKEFMIWDYCIESVLFAGEMHLADGFT